MPSIDSKSYKNVTSVKGLFYRGVVEDNNDPEKLDRVRVRVMGIHIMENSGSENVLHTDELPWAEVMAPTLFGMSTGIGISYVPLQGTWVWVFFENNDLQKPVVVGSSRGLVTKKQGGGFTDPDGVYPLEDRVPEPDTNRLHRNENYTRTALYKDRDPNLEIDVPFTTDGNVWNSKWDMPKQLNYLSEYPHNNVIETKSGHFIEIDDTPGNERIHVYHKSGSFTEFRPDGSVSSKVFSDKFHVNNGTEYELTKEDKNITVNRNKQTTTFGEEFDVVKKNWFKNVEKVISVKSKDNMYLTANKIFLN